MSLHDDVYGVSYRNALAKMRVMAEEMAVQENRGFVSVQALERWAAEHLLDKVLYDGQKMMCVSHKGEVLSPADFKRYYGSVLFTCLDGRRVPWVPKGYRYYDRAYVMGEDGDGIHRGMFHRNYFMPTGHYDEETGTFNVAKPFPVFAKETGADTSHIYTYIQHVAGECAPWLLAWLRAKMLHPTEKTQVVPIIVSRSQGNGKSSLAEVLCKGLFGKENVIVSDQYDATARFNADYADALIVCQEEREHEDKRNPTGTLKSRATAMTIRKERKGVDPVYQRSFTEFIMTTNKDVPVKFEGREDQRRFMVMEADDSFTRKLSKTADEVFTRLYGCDANMNKVGVPFVDDVSLIAQLKHELYTRSDIAEVDLRNFPKTATYRRCYSLPRTTEAMEVEGIIRALAPFLRLSLEKGAAIHVLPDGRRLSDILSDEGAMHLFPKKDTIALCRPVAFRDDTGRPYAHSLVERGLYEAMPWLKSEWGLRVGADTDPIPGGFPGITGRHSMACTARFSLAEGELPAITFGTNRDGPLKARPGLDDAVEALRKAGLADGLDMRVEGDALTIRMKQSEECDEHG